MGGLKMTPQTHKGKGKAAANRVTRLSQTQHLLLVAPARVHHHYRTIHGQSWLSKTSQLSKAKGKAAANGVTRLSKTLGHRGALGMDGICGTLGMDGKIIHECAKIIGLPQVGLPQGMPQGRVPYLAEQTCLCRVYY